MKEKFEKVITVLENLLIEARSIREELQQTNNLLEQIEYDTKTKL